jgi:hypothetical protein
LHPKKSWRLPPSGARSGQHWNFRATQPYSHLSHQLSLSSGSSTFRRQVRGNHERGARSLRSIQSRCVMRELIGASTPKKDELTALPFHLWHVLRTARTFFATLNRNQLARPILAMLRHNVLLTCLVCILACSSSSPGSKSGNGTGGGPPTIESACSVHASNECELLQRCNPYLIDSVYGDLETCKRRFGLDCPHRFGAEGSTWTAADVEACGNALPAYSCDEYLYSSKTLAACQPHLGALPDGAPCSRDEQCKGWCRPTSATCGVCQQRVAAGGACKSSDECSLGLACVHDACIPIVEEGGPCSQPPYVPSECAAQLVCMGAGTNDAGAGTCRKPSAAGAPCGPTDPLCDNWLGLLCIDGKCEAEPLADIGRMCGFMDRGPVACRASGTCDPRTAYCVASHPEGAPCISFSDCLWPARCANQGCTVVDPTICR